MTETDKKTVRRIGIISDTHGSLKDTKDALRLFGAIDLLIHVGDVLYHGPRNPLPPGYGPKELAAYLEQWPDEAIVFVRGNCDADVDEMVLGHDLSCAVRVIDVGPVRILALHGYRESERARLELADRVDADLVVTGHTHVKVLRETQGRVLLNPGSTTLPKDGSRSAALLDLDAREIQMWDLDAETVTARMNVPAHRRDERLLIEDRDITYWCVR